MGLGHVNDRFEHQVPPVVRPPGGTEFAVPAVRFSAIERPRLIERVLPPLLLVSAPAGYGKTTSVVHWVTELAVSVRWVVPAREQTGPEDFWRLLAGALGCTEGVQDGRSWRSLLEQAAASLTKETVLVIDDFHRVTGAETDVELADLLDLSPLLHLVVIGRRFQSIDGPLVTSRFDTGYLTMRELAFTWEETLELALVLGKEGRSDLPELFAASEGWPLPIHIVLSQGASISADAGDEGFEAKLVTIVDDLLRRVSRPADRRLLFASAVCPSVEATAMVRAIEEGDAHRDSDGGPAIRGPEPHSGVSRDHGSLENLFDLGLLVRVPPNDRFRIECHPGLAAELLRRAPSELGEEELLRLRRVCALDLEDTDPVSALALHCELGDYESADRVAERQFHVLISQACRVREILLGIPADASSGSMALGGLGMLLGVGDTAINSESFRGLTRRFRDAALRRVQHVSDLRPDAVCALIGAETQLGNAQSAFRLALDLERRLDDRATLEWVGDTDQMTLIHVTLAFAGLVSEEWAFADRHSRRAIQAAERSGNKIDEVRAIRNSVLGSFAFGRIVAAKKMLSDVRRLEAEWAKESGCAGSVVFDGFVTDALALAVQGDREGLERLLHEGASLRPRLVAGPFVLIAEVELVRLGRGAYQAVLELRRRLDQDSWHDTDDCFFTRQLRIYEVELLTVLGDLGLADHLLREAPADRPATIIAAARLNLFRGDPTAALHTIESLSPVSLTARERAHADLITAIGSWQLGMHDEALLAIRDATRQMESVTGYDALSWVPFQSLLKLSIEAEAYGMPELRAKVEELPATLRCEQFERLSGAEFRVLTALTKGLPLDQTADDLYISMNTLKFHLRSIYRKLHVAGKDDAVRRAVRIGLIERPRRGVETRAGKARSSAVRRA